ncbi:nitrophenyl compound nitroreductase subunit ArsF family protein [Draconibacterium sp.]|nr:nitrophenyl compound nitroreductase subunit ArsF family protein [Draconibacterium sp.]
MQTKNLLFLLTAFTTVSLSVWAEPGLKKYVEGEKTEVYYFHNTRRCPTCMAIEKETKKVLKEQPFADAEENEKLAFKSYNAENAANKKLVKKLGVTGSALIIMKGDEKIDLTSKGFMYALKQPEKFRQALRDALNE